MKTFRELVEDLHFRSGVDRREVRRVLQELAALSFEAGPGEREKLYSSLRCWFRHRAAGNLELARESMELFLRSPYDARALVRPSAPESPDNANRNGIDGHVDRADGDGLFLLTSTPLNTAEALYSRVMVVGDVIAPHRGRPLPSG